MDRLFRLTFGHVACSLLLGSVMTAGCGGSGPERYEVSGSVSFAGEEILEGGAVAFVPIEDTKGPRVGANIEQGRYHIDDDGGPVAGRHRVEVTLIRKTGRRINAGGQMVDQTMNVIPPKYSGKTSELVVEVEPDGDNVFDFDLTP